MQDCFSRCIESRWQNCALKNWCIVINWHACRPAIPKMSSFSSHELKNEFLRYTRGSDLHERIFRYLLLIILKEIINNRHSKYILRCLLLLQINIGEERLQILQMPFLYRCWAVKWIQKRGWSLQVCLEIVLIDLIYFFLMNIY